MHYPRISIVTPSFNQAKYLPETMESILNQGYPNLEYIVIDGGSTDGSADIIKRYERHLAYWVSEKDSGQSEAINKGLRRCTGELFNWINSDDILFPKALHHVAETFNRDPNAALIVGDNARCDKEGKIIRVSAAPARMNMSSHGWILWAAQQSTFISVATLRCVGEIREDLHCMMDGELYYRILRSGGRLIRTKSLVGMIREHPDAKGTVRKEGWTSERKEVFTQYRIAPSNHRIAKTAMRLYRLFDGSYVRSFVLSRTLRGARAADIH